MGFRPSLISLCPSRTTVGQNIWFSTAYAILSHHRLGPIAIISVSLQDKHEQNSITPKYLNLINHLKPTTTQHLNLLNPINLNSACCLKTYPLLLHFFHRSVPIFGPVLPTFSGPGFAYLPYRPFRRQFPVQEVFP